MAKKTSASGIDTTVETPTIEAQELPENPVDAGEQVAEAVEAQVTEVETEGVSEGTTTDAAKAAAKPLAEKTQKVRDANKALRESVADAPTLTQLAEASTDEDFKALAAALTTRFTDKVKVQDETGIWVWTGSTDYDGYPIYVDGNKKRWMAARYAVAIATGNETAKGQMLRHASKVHLDVNPGNMVTLTPSTAKVVEEVVPEEANEGATHSDDPQS